MSVLATASRSLPLLFVAGLLALLPSWRLGILLAPAPAEITLDLQGPRGGLIELRWGDAPTDSAPLWPGALVAGRHRLEIAATGSRNARATGVAHLHRQPGPERR